MTVVLTTTTKREFQSEEEFQAFVTDLENSKSFDFKVIIGLREQQDYFIEQKEDGYFGKEIKSTTQFKFERSSTGAKQSGQVRQK